MSAAAGRRRASLLVPALITLAGLALLIGLGTWQLQRRTWKEALIATLAARLAAPPAPLPAPAEWPQLTGTADEFRRVRLTATFLHAAEALVYFSGSQLRADVSGPGYWVMTPGRLADGHIVIVNRGFIPQAAKNPESRRAGQVEGPLALTAFLRWPQPRGLFTPADDPKANLWFARDPAGIAAAKGLGPVAPFYLDLEAPTPPGGLPKPGPLRINLPNDHLQYALTWFGLALALSVIFLIWAFRRRPAL